MLEGKTLFTYNFNFILSKLKTHHLFTKRADFCMFFSTCAEYDIYLDRKKTRLTAKSVYFSSCAIFENNLMQCIRNKSHEMGHQREAFILFSSVRDLTDKNYLNFTTEFSQRQRLLYHGHIRMRIFTPINE